MSFRALRQELIERPSLQGEEFCAALAAAADRWLGGLLEQATAGDTHGLALVAVGGYGRGELYPASDLDVVLVHRGRRDVTSVADKVWYPVWDEGIRLDHSVRSPGEVLEVAREDLRAQLGLLDGRVVAGDGEVAAPMLDRALAQWRSQARRWLPEVAAQVDERRRAHGDVAFLLEPDLKESHGGLRDLTVLRAAILGRPEVAVEVDTASLTGPHAVLCAARVELHRASGRASDRLLLQEQDNVAGALGYGDADALMAAIAEAGRSVAWVSDDAWRRLTRISAAAPRRRWWRRATPSGAPDERLVPVEAGIALLETEGAGGAEVVATEPDASPTTAPRLGMDAGEGGGAGRDGDGRADDLELALRVAAVAAERRLPIGRATLERLAAGAQAPPDPWTDDLRDALVRVLAAGEAAIPALEALDQRGLLVRLLPEWGSVRNRPQRNAYHRYTVDRHLLEAAGQAAAFSDRVERPDLLLLGALLHDIGKGSPGDHTDAGVQIVGRIGRRMGLPGDDGRVLTGLVRHHLLLPDVATRRDIDDPATVDMVATAVGDRRQLDLLAALTEADSLATGPAAWGQWKAGLVAALVQRVATRLEGGEVERTPLITDRHRGFMRQVERLGRSVVAVEVPHVTVVARDRPGLLSAVAGVLALRGLDVRSADVAGEDGFAVETFVVEPARGRWPDFKLVADELEAVLRGTFDLRRKLAEQARAYAGARRPASPRPVERVVTADNEASATSTVVDVRTEDAVGLLHRVTAALFAEDLDVVAARVATLGHEVVDAFYVRDSASGGKVTDPDRLAHICDSVGRAAESTA